MLARLLSRSTRLTKNERTFGWMKQLCCMNGQQKLAFLRHQIEVQLFPLVKGKVALFGLPCHGNIGDTYIAMGELSFLKSIGAKVIYTKMGIDSTPLPDLPHDCTILLQGGGDFGDVWRGIQECRLAVLRKYQNYKIIIFPQSVFYENNSYKENDAKALKNCTDLTICARDYYSYEVLKQCFHNNILLVPDMAFFIPSASLRKHMLPMTKQTLFLKRVDKELNQKEMSDMFRNRGDSKASLIVSDWPTIDNNLWCIRLNLWMVGITDALLLRKMSWMASFMRKLTTWQMINVTYPIVAKRGVQFLSLFNNLYLTRLHSAILAVLLDKKFALLDNSYHKNRYFYETWLKDLDLAQFLYS